LAGAFDVVNPLVEVLIREEGLALVDDISDGVREAVRRVIAYGWSDGMPVPAQARLIRNVVGLNERQTSAYNNYAAGLRSKGLDDNYVEHLTGQYAHRLLTQRAETIARTETIRGTMSAQVAQWRGQANVGLLQADRTKMVWKVTDDDRLCPYCAPMDGQVVDLFDDEFESRTKGFPDGFRAGVEAAPRRTLRPDPYSQPRDRLGRYISRIVKGNSVTVMPPNRWKAVAHPPLHPQCRCTLILKFQD
jgi:hypothetical protein